MPESAPISKSASRRTETPEVNAGDRPQIPAPLPHHHGPGIADSTPAAILPPTLTPATTTRQSVSLGALSTLWRGSNTPTTGPHTSSNRNPQPDTPIPSIITHAPFPDIQVPPELATSTGSLPSTTTTLTNTLPPTHSAALRALNAPAFQSAASSNAKNKSAKSTSSRTTLSSQPVVVRTYSGSRHSSRPSSALTSPRLFPSMTGHASQTPSALSAGLAGRSEGLPSVDDFSFSAILRAVDPEIRDAIDAIAEICARSRLSLADEYDAHLPPQGEITGAGPGWPSGMGTLVGRGRISRVGQGWSAGENTLTAVPEASSSSERLAGESRGSVAGSGGKTKRSRSAYGSLKSVISGGSGKRKADASQEEEEKPHIPHWAVHASSSASARPSITLIAAPQASKQLSLDISSTITEVLPEDDPEAPAELADPKPGPLHRRHTSATSIPHPRTRSTTLSSIASWIPWHRAPDLESGDSSSELTRAEARLREMLMSAQNPGMGKGKAPVNMA
ncbi:uncharacterized protein BDR25DRAFT_305327 [Lindgomyces ingoldianus]|uniref:Uncharacterized protein n=1 Tax=Lindgomyces ingoldianus TaxID=673940 RepID=A0ACB6QMS8_9PLEO|nr:uncharacterized protein BDR25DRAFT_305327 [Lindgomyces ingoldianus]KAF2467888.1 hypothetical protein BDR25DRAFT_305327 [Lindgomyces ingoldianus]